MAPPGLGNSCQGRVRVVQLRGEISPGYKPPKTRARAHKREKKTKAARRTKPEGDIDHPVFAHEGDDAVEIASMPGSGEDELEVCDTNDEVASIPDEVCDTNEEELDETNEDEVCDMNEDELGEDARDIGDEIVGAIMDDIACQR